MQSQHAIHHFFVYGTLKRGQVRAEAWPRPPRSVQLAWTRGSLFDLGSYPAMTSGPDLVMGELWVFAPAFVEETLRTLDEIEGYTNSANDLYRRVVLDCTTGDGEWVQAFGYHYVREKLLPTWRIRPKNGHCSWPIDGEEPSLAPDR